MILVTELVVKEWILNILVVLDLGSDIFGGVRIGGDIFGDYRFWW